MEAKLSISFITTIFLLVLISLMLISCGSEEPATTTNQFKPIDGASKLVTATPTPMVASNSRIDGEVYVKQVQVTDIDSQAKALKLTLKGDLSDGCTKIHRISQQVWSKNVVAIQVTTQRPADALCIEQLVPFQQEFVMNIKDLTQGAYTLRVEAGNLLTTTITIP